VGTILINFNVEKGK